MMKPIHFVLALALNCHLTSAVYVSPPAELTLLPQRANLVYYSIYNYDILKDETIVFDAENPCLNEKQRELQKALHHSGVIFRECYRLTDEQVERYLKIVNETQSMAQFQKANDECVNRKTTIFYEFNCYVQVVQDYLQKAYSYVHRPQNSLQWNIQYQLSLSKYAKLTKCTGAELKSLMEAVKKIQDDIAQCNNKAQCNFNTSYFNQK